MLEQLFIEFNFLKFLIKKILTEYLEQFDDNKKVHFLSIYEDFLWINLNIKEINKYFSMQCSCLNIKQPKHFSIKKQQEKYILQKIDLFREEIDEQKNFYHKFHFKSLCERTRAVLVAQGFYSKEMDQQYLTIKNFASLNNVQMTRNNKNMNNNYLSTEDFYHDYQENLNLNN